MIEYKFIQCIIKLGRAGMEAKNRRQQAMVDARKAIVLTAAKEVFARVGLDRASMREIAKQAGYTPGALYAYFAGKQELLVAIQEDLLNRLETVMQQVKSPKGPPGQVLLQKGQAWLAFFISQPRDLELTFFLLAGVGAQGLPTDASQRLHRHVRQTLVPIQSALVSLGATFLQAEVEMEALLAQGMGLLLSQDLSRLQAADQSPQALFGRYLQDLANRYQSGMTDGRALQVAIPQNDLFT
jgi:AcrR family transcriptional regulator